MFKKILPIILATTLFVGCSIESRMNVSGKGLPEHVSHVEFWNGGTKIYSADNARIVLNVSTTSKAASINSTRVQFYTYEITSPAGTQYIIDSEALAIMYRK